MVMASQAPPVAWQRSRRSSVALCTFGQPNTCLGMNGVNRSRRCLFPSPLFMYEVQFLEPCPPRARYLYLHTQYVTYWIPAYLGR